MYDDPDHCTANIVIHVVSMCIWSLTLSTLSNFNRLFHSLFWEELKWSVGVKGLIDAINLTSDRNYQILSNLHEDSGL